MEQHKIRSYGLYAVGEILLVVVGILIALQVNNWNEQNKLDEQINNALVEMREDLVENEAELKSSIQFLEEDLEAQENIIQTLEENRAFTEQTYRDLGRVMLVRRLVLTGNGYDLLKDLGISNLRDIELRKAIIDYYDRTSFTALREIEDDKMEFEGTWIEYVRRNFRDWDFGYYGFPNDDRQLQEDSYFLTMIRINVNNRSATLGALKNALEANSSLILTIEAHVEE